MVPVQVLSGGGEQLITLPHDGLLTVSRRPSISNRISQAAMFFVASCDLSGQSQMHTAASILMTRLPVDHGLPLVLIGLMQP